MRLISYSIQTLHHLFQHGVSSIVVTPIVTLKKFGVLNNVLNNLRSRTQTPFDKSLEVRISLTADMDILI